MADLRRRLEDATSRVRVLEHQLGEAITEREWWREQYRLVKQTLDDVRNPLKLFAHSSQEEKP